MKTIIFVMLILLCSCNDNKVARFKNKTIVKSEVHYNMLELITFDNDTLIVVLKDRFIRDDYDGFKIFGGNDKFIYYSDKQHIYNIEYLDVVKSTLE